MEIISQVAACLGKMRDIRGKDDGVVKRSPLEAGWTFVRSQLMVAKSNKDLPRELVEALAPLLSRAIPPSGTSPGGLSRFLDECVADMCRFQGALDARLRIRGEFEARLRAAVDLARQELRRENAMALARAKENASTAAASQARADVRAEIEAERAGMEEGIRAEVEEAHERALAALSAQHERAMEEQRVSLQSSSRVSQAMLSEALGSIGSPVARREIGGTGVVTALELQEEVSHLQEELRRERQQFDEEQARLNQELAVMQKRAMRAEADRLRVLSETKRTAVLSTTTPAQVTRMLERSTIASKGDDDDAVASHSPIATQSQRRLGMSTSPSSPSSSARLSVSAPIPPSPEPSSRPRMARTGATSASPTGSPKSPSTQRRLAFRASSDSSSKAKEKLLSMLADPVPSALLADVLNQLGACLSQLKEVDRTKKGIPKNDALQSTWSFVQSELFKTSQMPGVDPELSERLQGILGRSLPGGKSDAAVVFFFESVLAEVCRAHGCVETKATANSLLHRARAVVIECWPAVATPPTRSTVAPPAPPSTTTAGSASKLRAERAQLQGALVDAMRHDYDELLRRLRGQYKHDVEALTMMLEDEREAHDRIVRVTGARVRADCKREKDAALQRLRDDHQDEKLVATQVIREELERKIARLQARVMAAESRSADMGGSGSRHHTLPPELDPRFASFSKSPAGPRTRDDGKPFTGFGSSAQRFTPVKSAIMQWYETTPSASTE